MNDGRTHHWCKVYDGSQVSVYIDGYLRWRGRIEEVEDK